MQQWICHIQGLENVFGAREVERIGRQIDGVEDLSVDFAGEILVLKADSIDVFKKLEKALALSGYRLLKKNYYVTSVLLVPELESDVAQATVRQLIGSHTQVQKMEIRPLSKHVYLTHDVDYPIGNLICDLNNQDVTAHMQSQRLRRSFGQRATSFSILLAAVAFISAVIFERLHLSDLVIQLSYVASVLITGTVITKHAFKKLTLHRKLTYEFIVLLAVLMAMSYNYWLESALLGLTLAICFMLEERASWKLKQQWSLLKSMIPFIAYVKKDENLRAVPVESIQINDVLVVNAGDYVPVDGLIIEGKGEFSTRNINDDGERIKLCTNDNVYAGLKLKQGAIEVKAISTASQSHISTLLRKFENLQTQLTSKQQAYGKKMDFALYGFLLISIVLIALQMMPSPVLSAIWMEKVLVLMVISGSAFALTSIQFSYLFAYLFAAKKGIYFFEPSIWGDLENSKCMAVEKTGVLTDSKPEVQEVISLTNYSTSEILSLAASLAVVSKNARFAALIQRANSSNVELYEISKIIDSGNKFVRAELQSKLMTLGSQKVMSEMGLLTDTIASKLKRWQGEGENIMLLADEKDILGMITVLDPIRAEVGEFVDLSHELGMKRLILLTNDNEGSSQIISNRYGFDEVIPELSSSEMDQRVKEISENEVLLSIASRKQQVNSKVISVHSNALLSGLSHAKNHINFLGKNLLALPGLLKVTGKLQSRTRRLMRTLMNVKILILIAVFLNVIGLGAVILIEFLLAVWILSSTYKPQLTMSKGTTL